MEGGRERSRSVQARAKRVQECPLRYRYWRQLEDLTAWRSKALRAWERLAGGAEGLQAAEAAEDEGIDIAVEDVVRVPTVIERVDEMIHKRLVAEGLLPSEAVAGQAHARGRGSGSGRKRAKRRAVPDSEVEQQRGVSEFDVDSSEDAFNQAAPLSKVREVEDRRLQETKTSIAQLVRRMRDHWTPFDERKHMGGLGDYFSYVSATCDDMHKWWMQKLQRQGLELKAHEPLNSDSEVILTVAVCNQAGVKEQEFDVLASQHLYELRDAFHFASDWMYDGPTRLSSACMFIDGIFYSDRRDPLALDYSKELIEWLKATRPGFLRAGASKSMGLRFSDLERIPFGEKGVYIHQGDIEHGLIFTGCRLMMTHSDCPFREAYPLLTFMRQYRKRKCYACIQNLSIWVVFDSSRCPYNPSFWCQSCFRHFFQDAEGQYLPPIDYKVFPYLHDDV